MTASRGTGLPPQRTTPFVPEKPGPAVGRKIVPREQKRRAGLDHFQGRSTKRR